MFWQEIKARSFQYPLILLHPDTGMCTFSAGVTINHLVLIPDAGFPVCNADTTPVPTPPPSFIPLYFPPTLHPPLPHPPHSCPCPLHPSPSLLYPPPSSPPPSHPFTPLSPSFTLLPLSVQTSICLLHPCFFSVPCGLSMSELQVRYCSLTANDTTMVLQKNQWNETPVSMALYCQLQWCCVLVTCSKAASIIPVN